MFRIEMLPANHGDGLWIEYGTPPDTHHVLIDGGPPYAKEELEGQLARVGGHLELLVISHVDFDHIGGIVSLLARLPDGVRIDATWFNAWKHLPGSPGDTLGAVQGEMVSAAITARNLPWNLEFGEGAVAVSANAPPPALTLPGGLRLTVLAPQMQALAALRPKWRKEVEEQHLTPGDFEDGLRKLRERERLPDDVLGEAEPKPEKLDAKPFVEDQSLPNRSSIALLTEYDGRSMLLAADSPPAALLPGIEALLRERGEQRLKVDALKLAHHGSKGSTSAALLDRLDCPRYLVSTNGKIYGHPSPETLARAILHGGKGQQLLFNYRTSNASLFDSDRLRRRYKYETVFPSAAGTGLSVEL
jgi:Metallo-beta-lactamase superfamily